jgi:hypothetical protein
VVFYLQGTFSELAGNPSVSAQTIGRIGVNVVTPTANLHIGASTTLSALMRLNVGSANSTK